MPTNRSTSIEGTEQDDWVVLGKVSGQFGVHGWIKVYSYTSPRENILQYREWYLKRSGEWVAHRLKGGKSHGKGVIARLDGCDNRDHAIELMDAEVAIRPEQLAETGEDEFYWRDLEGLQVVTLEGVELGKVDYLFETGANDVMVVRGKGEMLLPFIEQVIREVDLDNGVIRVDWDEE